MWYFQSSRTGHQLRGCEFHWLSKQNWTLVANSFKASSQCINPEFCGNTCACRIKLDKIYMPRGLLSEFPVFILNLCSDGINKCLVLLQLLSAPIAQRLVTDWQNFVSLLIRINTVINNSRKLYWGYSLSEISHTINSDGDQSRILQQSSSLSRRWSRHSREALTYFHYGFIIMMIIITLICWVDFLAHKHQGNKSAFLRLYHQDFLIPVKCSLAVQALKLPPALSCHSSQIHVWHYFSMTQEKQIWFK